MTNDFLLGIAGRPNNKHLIMILNTTHTQANQYTAPLSSTYRYVYTSIVDPYIIHTYLLVHCSCGFS